MSTEFSTFIQSILLEAAIDRRIPSGVLDISNDEHRMVIAEKLIDRSIDPNLVLEVVNKMALKDGKYPDRQAYNKEGWLVTFPTPEHRLAAIKNKTHFTSDPTHGQGGMNLYYKRKGKQARQQQQDTSETEPVDKKQPAQPATPSAEAGGNQPKVQPTDGDASQADAEATTKPTATDGSQAKSDGDGHASEEASQLPAAGADAKTAGGEPIGQTSDASGNGSQSEKTPTEPAQPDTSALIRLTQEFARSKQWTDTPYGDWNDSRGQHVAVTGLDGQIVPIKFTDREELKSFAEKRMTEGVSIREMLNRTVSR